MKAGQESSRRVGDMEVADSAESTGCYTRRTSGMASALLCRVTSRILYIHFQTPLIILFIAFQNIDISVIGANLKIEVIRAVPPVDKVFHLKFCFSEDKADRPFMGRIPGITGYLDFNSIRHNTKCKIFLDNSQLNMAPRYRREFKIAVDLFFLYDIHKP